MRCTNSPLSKRAQAAMEYLMTYGWALLVVLSLVAILAYFGVLSPIKFLPEECIMQSAFDCSAKITMSESTIVLTNTLAEAVSIQDIHLGACTAQFASTLGAGVQDTFTLTNCQNGEAQSRLSADLTISYKELDSGLEKSAYGEISTTVE